MKFIETIKNVWKITELKDRIILTLGLLLVYRFGAQVVLPGIDASQLGSLASKTDSGLLGLLNAFTGGAFAKASIFALGIMPYISASIVVQLMGIAIPYLQKLQKEGASGQKKITQITRWLTIGICLVQAPAYLASLPALMGGTAAFTLGQGGVFYFSSVIILVTGCVFAMWLGEKITDKGIGNGISLLIMVGIIATMPLSFAQEFDSAVNQSQGGLIKILIELVIWFVIILASIMLVMAVRKIAVQYARRTASGGYEKNIMGSRQYIPLKLNASGVMPIIFAQSIMFIPSTIATFFSDNVFMQGVMRWFSFDHPFYWFIFGIMIVFFTYFYTAIAFDPTQVSLQMKQHGGFIPGIRPGKKTAEYIDNILSKVTLPGSFALALVAIFPYILMQAMDVGYDLASFFGGTSLLIIVGVALDTLQQIESHLMSRHYDGFLSKGKIRGRRRS